MNSSFEEFCNNNSIVHEFTISYSPQQNGRIEKLHDTLIPNARAILKEKKNKSCLLGRCHRHYQFYS